MSTGVHSTTILANQSPTTRDLEWVAGFLEGEGCFSKNGRRRKSEHLSAAQVNPEPLWKLQELFGGAVNARNPNITSNQRQKYWVWQVSGSRARGIMLTLYGLLSAIRQTQVQEALRDY